ncbi:MAG: HEAT repeat domain-containing protein [Opitutaceae bacterium]|nr:HEAT repeat domain-containing protein [Verrucomicrobiales bacterium]
MGIRKTRRWWLMLGVALLAAPLLLLTGYLVLRPPAASPQASAADLKVHLHYLQRQDTAFDRLYFRTWSSLPPIVQDQLRTPVLAANERRVAADYLGRMGSAALPAVPALLKSLSDPAVHYSAETALLSMAWESVRQGNSDWVAPFVLTVLNDTNRPAWSDELRRAAHLVGVMGITTPPYLDALRRLAETGENMVQTEAVQVLGILGADMVRNGSPVPENLVASLGLAMESRNEMTRREALQAIGKIAVKSEVAETRILEALSRETSSSAFSQLVEAAVTMKVDSARLAAVLESVMKKPPVPTQPLNVPAGLSQYYRVDFTAAQSLWKVSPAAARRNLPFYLDHLDDNPSLLGILEEMKPAPADVIPRLTARIGSTPDEWICSLAETIWKISPENQEAIPRLHQVVEGANGSIRNRAAFTLWKIHGETNLALRVLIESLGDRTNRTSAARYLGEMGGLAHDAVPVLRGMIQETNNYVRTSAAFALWRINGETSQIVRMLTDGLKPSSPSDSIYSAQLLGRMGAAAQDALPALRRFAQQNPQWREMAARAIDQIEEGRREQR